jgi:glucose uptake protein GlcU
MNFSPEISTPIAVFLSLFAAFLWGTWFISLKYLDGYPIDAFYMTLFFTSIILVWGVGLLLDGGALIANMQSVFASDPSMILATLICGVLYVIGIRISLVALQLIGLSLSQPIQASFNILVGTLISGLIGGIPAGVNPALIALACLLLVIAVFFSMAAGQMRSRELSHEKAGTGRLQFSAGDLRRAAGWLFLSSTLLQAYTFALSYGLRTVSHPQGLATMPFMALLASGAFVGALLSSGLLLTLRSQWGSILRAPFAIHQFGILSGLFHYGGNIIHTFGTTALSPVISWPLGVTMGLWTQFWGLVYGEFKGASRRTYAALFAGIVLYLVGAYLVGMQGR